MNSYKRICPLLLAFILSIASFISYYPVIAISDNNTFTKTGNQERSTVTLNYASENDLISEMNVVAKNSNFELYIHPKNLVIAVKDLKTNKIHFSNPYNAAYNKAYTGNIKSGLNSQIVVQYSDSGSGINSLWSADSCTELGQYEIKQIKNGAEILMSIGEEKERRLIPEKISVERFESKIIKKIDGSTSEGKNALRQLNILYKKTKENGKEIYICRKLNDKEKNEIEKSIKLAGYTLDDMDKDHAENGVTVAATAFPNFKIAVDYTLTKNGLHVSIPSEKISFDSSNYNLISIKVLEYFDAVNADENHEGYVFVPDGSGTIIPFKTDVINRQSLISGKVYGFDCSTTYPDIPRSGSQFHLPVFGIKCDDSGFFANITEGSAMSTISAYSGTHFGSFFTSFATFIYTTREELALDQKVSSHGSSATAYLYDSNFYKGDYTVDYTLLRKSNSSYFGMASLYKEYLINQGMQDKSKKTDIFLGLDTVGTISYTSKFFGIPYNAAAKLSTFNDDISLIKKLKDNSVDEIILTLKDWRSGGEKSSIANSVNPASCLGGKSGFKSLIKYTAANDVELYPDFDLLFISKDNWFDGFNAKKDSCRMMNDKLGGYMTVRPDTSQYDKSTFQYALSPLKYDSVIKSLSKQIKKYDISSIGFSSVGKFIISNYKKKSLVNRQQSLDIITKQLKAISSGKKVMIEGGNGYALPYASYVKNVPTTSSNYNGTLSIPFIQLVLNGSVKYSSEAINLSSDYDQMILHCIESATSPNFILAYNNIIKIKQTQYTKYYSIGSEHWLNAAIEGYNKVSQALKPVQNAVISGHEYLPNNIIKVSYSNGYTYYINYNSTDININGKTIKANSFSCLKGDA